MMIVLPGSESLPEWLQVAPGLLFDVALKGLLISGVLFLLSPLLRRFSAATRSFVWAVGLAAVIILPVVSYVAPVKQIDVFPVVVASGERVQIPQPDQAIYSGENDSRAVSGAEGGVWSGPVNPGGAIDAPRPAPDPMMGAGAFLWEKAKGLSLLSWLLLVWALGAGAVLINYLVGTAQAWRLVRQAHPVVDPEWLGLAEGIRVGNRMRRPVRLIRSSRALMPLTWGIFYPVVLLSGDADEWTPDRRRVVLMHEYAHVVRLDCLSQVVAQLSCALHWFNPLVWWTARKLAMDREQSCDDHVLVGAPTTASDYARHLLEIACTLPTSYASPLAGVAMARPSSLEERIRAILDPERRRRLLNRSTASVVILLASIVLLPVAVVRTWGIAEKKATPAPEAEVDLSGMYIDLDQMNEELAQMQVDLEKMNFDFQFDFDFEHMQNFNHNMNGPGWAGKQGIVVWAEKLGVSPGGRFDVSIPDANLRIEPGAADEAYIEAHVTGLEPEAAREFFSKLNFHIEQNGNTVALRADPRILQWNDMQDVGLEIVARVPHSFNLDLKTSDGNVNLGSFEGQMNIRTSDGNINTGNLDGPTILIETSDGNVNSTRLSGSRVDVISSDGNINLAGIRGEQILLETSDGNVNVGSAEGDVKVSLSDGNLNFGSLKGSSISLEAGDGNITTGRIDARRSVVKVSDGSITLGRAGGALNIEAGGGDIHVVLDSPEESSIRSGEGDIHVDLTPNARIKLVAEGSRVQAGHLEGFEGSREENLLKGNVNGGGPTVQIFTGEGNIFVN